MLTLALGLVIFPLIGTASLKENWQLSFPKTFGTTKVHVLSLSVSCKATWKNVVHCSFFHVPEQEIDSNCIVKPITISLYSFLPQKTNIVCFSKSLIYYFQRPGWELMGENARAVQTEACTRATAWKAKLNWELKKLTSFYFCRQLTIRETCSGIWSMLQAQVRNNFLSLILIDNFAIELTQLETHFPTPNPPQLCIGLDFHSSCWDEQQSFHHQGAHRRQTPCGADMENQNCWVPEHYGETLGNQSRLSKWLDGPPGV